MADREADGGAGGADQEYSRAAAWAGLAGDGGFCEAEHEECCERAARLAASAGQIKGRNVYGQRGMIAAAR